MCCGSCFNLLVMWFIYLTLCVCLHYRIDCSLWSLACWDRGSWISWTSTARRWFAPPRTSLGRCGTWQKHETEQKNESKIACLCMISLSFHQCVMKSVSQISEIDADTVKWVKYIYMFNINIATLIITTDCVSVCDVDFMSRCVWWRFISGLICCWIFLNTSSYSSRESR